MIDKINSFFPFLASFFVFLSLRQTLKDRELKGVSLSMIIFFTLWSYWSIYMFFVEGKLLSMIANCILSTVYTIWLFVYLNYEKE